MSTAKWKISAGGIRRVFYFARKTDTMDFIEVLATATIPAIITGLIAYFGNRVELLKYRSESMAERTAKHYLSHKGYTDRKFETIKMYLGGWDEEPDELRKILVKAGAIRTYRKVKGQEVEYWTLLDRVPEKIKKIKAKKRPA